MKRKKTGERWVGYVVGAWLGVWGACLPFATGVALGEEAGGRAAGWPLFRGDANMTGVSQERLDPPLVPAWDFATGAPVPGTAVIAEGRAYMGSLDGNFYALDLATGRELWKAPGKLGVEGPACVAGDLVCFGDADGKVHGLDRVTGEARWVYETGDAVAGGLNSYRTRAGKTILLVGSDDFLLHAIDAVDGTRVWVVETDNYIKGTPSVDQEGGVVIFGGCDELVRLIDAETGEMVREMNAGAYLANSCAVRDQIAYVANYAGEVLALDLRTGETVWKHLEERTEFVASPAVTADRVYVTGRDQKLRCLDRGTGQLVWEFRARRGIDSSPVVTEGAVYFGADDGRLYAVKPGDGSELWSFDLGSRINSSVALAEGHLVIGSQEGTVFAFRCAGE